MQNLYEVCCKQFYKFILFVELNYIPFADSKNVLSKMKVINDTTPETIRIGKFFTFTSEILNGFIPKLSSLTNMMIKVKE